MFFHGLLSGVSVLILCLFAIVPLIILYFIIKRAVRNGILEAREIIEEEDCIK